MRWSCRASYEIRWNISQKKSTTKYLHHLAESKSSSLQKESSGAHVRFKFLLLFTFFRRFFFFSYQHQQQQQQQYVNRRYRLFSLLSNFPSTQYTNVELESWRRRLEKLVFLRNSSRLELAPTRASSVKEMERKRKKAISLLKRWFFTVDRLSWWTKLKVNGWKTEDTHLDSHDQGQWVFVQLKWKTEKIEKIKKIAIQWIEYNRVGVAKSLLIRKWRFCCVVLWVHRNVEIEPTTIERG